MFLEGTAMNKNACFMRWWLMNAVIAFVAFVCWRFGLFYEIYQKDSSYLCLVIMMIFCWISGYNGNVAYTLDSKNKIESKLGPWPERDASLLGVIAVSRNRNTQQRKCNLTLHHLSKM